MLTDYETKLMAKKILQTLIEKSQLTEQDKTQVINSLEQTFEQRLNSVSKENNRFHKIATQISEGTYKVKEQTDSPSLSDIQFDQTDLYLDPVRHEAGKPEYLVVDPKCLGYSTKSSLKRAIANLTSEVLTEQNIKLLAGFRPLLAGRDFQIEEMAKKGCVEHFNIYLASYAIVLLKLRRSKSITAIASKRQPELETTLKELNDKRDLSLSEITYPNIAPELYQRLQKYKSLSIDLDKIS